MKHFLTLLVIPLLFASCAKEKSTPADTQPSTRSVRYFVECGVCNYDYMKPDGTFQSGLSNGGPDVTVQMPPGSRAHLIVTNFQAGTTAVIEVDGTVFLSYMPPGPINLEGDIP